MNPNSKEYKKALTKYYQNEDKFLLYYKEQKKILEKKVLNIDYMIK
jgi:hypothetical protein